MRPAPLLGLLALACAAPTPAQGLAPGRYVREVESGGLKRSYILRVPKGEAPAEGRPVVMVLHGWTASAALAEVYTGMADEAEKRGFVAVFPDGVGRPQGWNAGFLDLSGQKKDDVKFLDDTLDDVERAVRVDPKRIYVCGHSNGAMMTHAYAAARSERIAAAGAVAGTIGLPNAPGTPNIPLPKSPVPMMIIHGEQDEMVAYAKASRALLQGVGALDAARWWAKADGLTGEPKKTESPDGKTITTTWGDGVVTLVTLPQGRHDWPGGVTRRGPETSGVSAARLLMEFFEGRRR